MSLAGEIAAWDGKSAAAIKRVFEAHAQLPGFTEALVAMMPDPNLERGATWLLKHFLERQKQSLPEEVAAQIHAYGTELLHWEARLHYLQIIAYIPIPREARAKVQAFAETGLEEGRTLIRAWSYNALFYLAECFPDLRPSMDERFKSALSTEAAGSVKARIRALLKQTYLTA